jgi:serine/threonine protein phosphatase PrpC
MVPLAERYDAMFSQYESPPYVSSHPDVTKIEFGDGLELPVEAEYGSKGRKWSFMAILASDGLWDLIQSNEAVGIVREAAMLGRERNGQAETNLARNLLDKVIERNKRKPGDDVTILVLIW